jgi:hypothetical protein
MIPSIGRYCVLTIHAVEITGEDRRHPERRMELIAIN